MLWFKLNYQMSFFWHDHIKLCYYTQSECISLKTTLNIRCSATDFHYLNFCNYTL